ncbi:MAG: diacylglycerol kinase family protein [Chthoniobacterales bacterium]
MKITLIHNPTAGVEAYSGKKLVSLLKKADHNVTYVSVKDADYKNAYKQSTDLLLAAGGDGTVRRVAQQAITRGIPMSILPTGTNNYVAEALGITAEPEDIISSLDTARKTKLDAGVVKGPWGEVKFITACGFGLVPNCLRTVERRRKQGRNIEYLSLLREKAAKFKAQYCEVFLDGNDVSGEYFLLEIMNIPTIAPGLIFAPNAKMADGYMEFVMALEADRPAFVKTLENDEDPHAFTLPSRQFKHMHMEIPDSLTHIDDRLRPKNDDTLPTHAYIDIHVLSEGVEFLLAGNNAPKKTVRSKK